MELSPLTAIAPVDGRYAGKTAALRAFFSEYALIRYRVLVEVEYLIALSDCGLPGLEKVSEMEAQKLRQIVENFSPTEAEKIKSIEKTTNHDVKAVEYFLRDQIALLGMNRLMEFIHFGLTSQDINNTALPMMIRDGINQVLSPLLSKFVLALREKASAWEDLPLLAHTHGQPASPTRLGKELMVFVERLEKQTLELKSQPYCGKFGGATGNFNAHAVAYPQVDWKSFADHFLSQNLGLVRQQFTTQIEHYDGLAALFHNLIRINTILTDFSRDVWSYVSMEYFGQEVVAGEVGSSAMPHKVNPIDFENAEGNLAIANALFGFLAEKLPVSRLQRDLTDSTVTRNIGVPFAHTLIALESLLKGLGKLKVNREKIMLDLERNWSVLAEAYQTILRREGYPHPYEALKQFSRGKSALTKADYYQFIDALEVSEALKTEMKKLTPWNYTGL